MCTNIANIIFSVILFVTLLRAQNPKWPLIYKVSGSCEDRNEHCIDDSFTPGTRRQVSFEGSCAGAVFLLRAVAERGALACCV